MKQQFDHEKLHVYQLSLAFIRWLTPMLRNLRQTALSESSHTRDHLDRAALSIVFNTAEGNGKRIGKSRRRFFDDARGSATECAACLDVLVAKGLLSEEQVDEGKQLLLRIVQMLSKLILLSLDRETLRDTEGAYEVEDEADVDHEHEDDHEDVTN